METKAVRVGVSFKLTVSFPTAWRNKTEAALFTKTPREEIEAALWAWETFGGIGARTRRGFGAILCTDISENGKVVAVQRPENSTIVVVEKWVQTCLQYHIGEGRTWHGDIPHLIDAFKDRSRPCFKVVNTFADPPQPVITAWRNFIRQSTDPATIDILIASTKAWRYLIASLREFRQAREGSNNRGRSLWPEPNAIRRKTGLHSTGHEPPASGVDKFPRGVMGLPIIFHFKDRGEPGDTTLQGAHHDRLTSPLILRPIICANNQAVGLALILESPRTPPDGLILKDAPGNELADVQLVDDEADTILPLKGQKDVLQAFLDYL